MLKKSKEKWKARQAEGGEYGWWGYFLCIMPISKIILFSCSHRNLA